MEIKPWSIVINNWGGFAPAWFRNSWTAYGNKNMASDMKNIDLIDPNILTQGPAPVALTNGTEAGAVTTTVRSFLKMVTAADTSYAIGGARLYKLSATTVQDDTADTPFPHLIDKGTVTAEDGEDICYYQSKLYYFYNHSGSAGDIGLHTPPSTFDDDWGSTVPTGYAALQYGPHQAIVGGDDQMYFTNGKYVGRYKGSTTTLDPVALDFWTDSVCASITWNENRIKVAVNRPNIAGANLNQSGIYTWNGSSTSWEGDPVEVNGKIGALYTKNGVTYVWWQDSGTLNEFNFGYVSGTQLKSVKRCKGSLPLFYQVSEDKGFITWISDGLVYYWGSADPELPAIFFQRTSSTYTDTVGGLGNPFGTILTASHNTTTGYNIAKASGYSVDVIYKTKVFDMTAPGYKSVMDKIFVYTEELDTGAKCEATLTYNKGKNTQTLSDIAENANNLTLHKLLNKSHNIEDFRLDLDCSEGSATNPVKIRSILIQGHYSPEN
jgi:hypothetical protein